MIARYRPDVEPPKKQGLYFEDPVYQFIPTGCTLLDCILGGGWPLGRVANIVGDKSTGKTLLAIEAAANCSRTFPKAKIWYRESEAAFDIPYARSVGLPAERVNFGKKGIDTQWRTIEDVFEDLETQLDAVERGKVSGGLYIVDSLDALTSRAALKRDVDKGTFGLEKPKVLGQLFSQLVGRLKQADVCVMFVSQVRERIGLVFGDKYTRTGGKALDFYASQAVWLAQIGMLKRTMRGVERVVGINIRANCKKNKVGAPLRKCDFLIRFGFGVDDLETNLDWLVEVGRTEVLGIPSTLSAKERDARLNKYIANINALPDDEYRAELEVLRNSVLHNWGEVEHAFLPTRAKYG